MKLTRRATGRLLTALTTLVSSDARRKTRAKQTARSSCGEPGERDGSEGLEKEPAKRAASRFFPEPGPVTGRSQRRRRPLSPAAGAGARYSRKDWLVSLEPGARLGARQAAFGAARGNPSTRSSFSQCARTAPPSDDGRDAAADSEAVRADLALRAASTPVRNASSVFPSSDLIVRPPFPSHGRRLSLRQPPSLCSVRQWSPPALRLPRPRTGTQLRRSKRGVRSRSRCCRRMRWPMIAGHAITTAARRAEESLRP